MVEPGSGVRKIIILLPLFLHCCLAFAQDPKSGQKSSKGEQAQLTFKVPVDVVVVNAVVTDKSGTPVLDLTADDFRVFEDGKPQPIHTFALESYKAIQSIDPTGKRGEPGEAKEPNFTQPRLFSLVIDDVTSSRDYVPTTTEAMKQFVERDLGPGDMVSIYAASGRIQYPFTSDKQLLLAQINSLFSKLDLSSVSRSTCPTMTDLQAQRIVNQFNDGESLDLAVQEALSCLHFRDESDPGSLATAKAVVHSTALMQHQETLYRDRILLRSLRQHIRSLKHFEGRKNIILFSDGFLFEDLTYDLQDVVDQALRAGAVMNTVDIRGLYVPMFQASDRFSVSSLQMLVVKQRLLSEDATAQQDPLAQLAHDTGGLFYHNSNDLHAGIKEIADRRAHYYILTYATPSQKSDGRYHKIKLEVSHPGVQISYRNGYYAPKEQLNFERRKKEDILEALRAPGNVNEIPVNFSYNSYQLEDSRFEVELVARVDIRRMLFAEEDSRRRNLISMVIVALDESDHYIDGLLKDVSFNLTPSSYGELLNRGFASKVTIHVPPGRYKIRTIVRESVQSKMGSLTKIVEIP